MYGIAILLLMLCHSAYLVSPYVAGILPANEMAAQEYIYGGYVLVYMVSFFKVGKVRYLLVIPYLFMMIRVVPSLFYSARAGDFLFFGGALLAQALLLIIVYGILKNIGVLFSGDRRQRLFVGLWIVTISMISLIHIKYLMHGINVLSALYSISFIIAFIVTSYSTIYKNILAQIQTVLLMIIAMPYFMALFDFPSSTPARVIVSVTLLLVVSTLFSLFSCMQLEFDYRTKKN